MSEVKRWKFKRWIGSFVASEEFDKLSDALSENTKAWHRTADNFYKDSERHKQEMAALREELAECNKRKAWWVDSAKTLDERLTAAEQRNADAEKLLRETSAVLRGGECYGWEDNQADQIDAFLGKPTESGASE
jgi:hypothetical protein